MLQEDGDQDCLKGQGPRRINSRLDMEPGFFEETIEKLLILPPQSTPKLPPFLDLLFQNPAKGQNCSSHNKTSRKGVRVGVRMPVLLLGQVFGLITLPIDFKPIWLLNLNPRPFYHIV